MGKLLSRAGIGALSVVVVLVVANAVVYRGYGGSYLLPFWIIGTWMIGYVLVWTAVVVGYSAAFGSRYRALGALGTTYGAFSLQADLWSVVVRPVPGLVVTGRADAPAYEHLSRAPVWLQGVERLNPMIDFWAAARWSIRAVGPGAPTGDFLPQVAGTVVFVPLEAVPLTFGLHGFERADMVGERREFSLGAFLWQRLTW